MRCRSFWLLLVLVVCPIMVLANDIPASTFVKNPPPASGQFLTPRVLAVNPTYGRCYVLDSGLQRIVAVTPDGQQVAEWPLDAFGVHLPLPADPLLPAPAICVGAGTTYLLNVDRSARQVDMMVVEGAGRSRTVNLTDGTAFGAFLVDDTGHLLVASLLSSGGKTELQLSRENDAGELKTLATLPDPCDGQVLNLYFTGFVMDDAGHLAMGIAQKSSNTAYSYVRSWFVMGNLKTGTMTQAMHVVKSYALLDAQGRVQERFRAAVALAGRRGYPIKPCVPLFTSLVFWHNGSVISGGHTVDPFLRVYAEDGTLLRSVPRVAVGGEHLAVFSAKDRLRLFATAPTEHHIIEYSDDGRVIGGFGIAAPYDLSQPVTLAANSENVYVMVRYGTLYQLVNFSADGRFLWAQTIQPPNGMTTARPCLALTSSSHVLIGWKMPKAAGVGWVETVLLDGSYGLPLWNDPFLSVANPNAPVCDTPVIVGDNDQVYVLREMKGGARVVSFSPTGTLLQSLPAAVQGVTAVNESGNMAWACSDTSGMIMVSFSPQGVKQGWKRVPRPANHAMLFPAQARGLWGWLSSTESLLRFDETLTAVDELFVKDADGKMLHDVVAVTGDGAGRIYLAVSGQIVMVEP